MAKKRPIWGKGTPSYPLEKVKKLIRENKAKSTLKAMETANNMCLTVSQVYDEILNLRHVNFYKSVPDNLNNKAWQDVYKKEIVGFSTYIKFKIVNDTLLLLSSKPDESK